MKLSLISLGPLCGPLAILSFFGPVAMGQAPILEEAYVTASNPSSDAEFGESVGISGDTMVVGCPRDDTSAHNAGAAYVYTRSAGVWTLQVVLMHPDPDSSDLFGQSVAIEGGRIIVGVPYDDSSSSGTLGNPTNNGIGNSGAVVVFEGGGASWTQMAFLKASNPGLSDAFGWSVDMDGDTIVVGAPQEDSDATGVDGDQNDNGERDSGAAYVFVGNGASWAQQAYLKAANTDADDEFGNAVAVYGNSIVVGAWLEAAGGYGTGAAYTFARSGGTWAGEMYIKSSNFGQGDSFGHAVDMGDDIMVIGAHLEDSNATGIDGSQGDWFMGDYGAAYVFERTGSHWSQSAYVKPNDVNQYGYFGKSVSISGRSFVVGSPTEDSTATGVNGNSDSGAGSHSGATYLFVPDGASWKQAAYIKASNSILGCQFGRSLNLAGDRLAVGAVGFSTHAGAAYAFNMDAQVANFCGTPVANSSGMPGSISMGGSLVVLDNDFTLHATSLPLNEFGFFLNSQGHGFVPTPGVSQGNFCLGGSEPLGRHNRLHEIRFTGPGGAFSLTLDLTDIPTALGIHSVVAGETWNFQAWFRDTNPGSTSNFTDGLSVQFE